MNSDSNIFYIHEDDWGLKSLLPYENVEATIEQLQRSEEFSDAHFDGQFWTDVYLIPEESHPISIRRMPLQELQTLFSDLLKPAARVESGYSTYRETLQHAFAFGKTYQLALYGEHREGIITQLYFYGSLSALAADATIISRLAEKLCYLGREYNLILVDWTHNSFVDLHNREAIDDYLTGDGED